MLNGRRLLAVYQIIGGIISLFSLMETYRTYGAVVGFLLLLFAGLAIFAGVSLWRGLKNGWCLSQLNQVLQLVGFYTPVFAYNVLHGVGFTLGTRYFAAEKFAAANFHTSGQIVLGGSVFEVLWGEKLAGMPDYGLSLNLLALGVLIYAVFARRKATSAAR